MNKFMFEANERAKINLLTNAGGPFGAVVVKDDKVVGSGSNLVLSQHDPTAHAEIVAIREACHTLNTHDLSGCELYTSCYPCPMCLSAIIWSNIKTVYYGNTKEDAEAVGFRDDFIYDYFKTLPEGDDQVLSLISLDRDETVKTFIDHINKDDKEIY